MSGAGRYIDDMHSVWIVVLLLFFFITAWLRRWGGESGRRLVAVMGQVVRRQLGSGGGADSMEGAWPWWEVGRQLGCCGGAMSREALLLERRGRESGGSLAATVGR